MSSASQPVDRTFITLTALFVAALVTCNLIANKFVAVDLGFHVFVVSAGILPYPVTFLVTDLLSEVYGRRRANQVVVSGFAASIFVLVMLALGDAFPAVEGSPVGDATYSKAFSNAYRVIAASMIAYLSAQLIDVRLFHFWKRLTNGRHLWLRNNASTICSQLVDTTLVVMVLFWGTDRHDAMGELILHGWTFKLLVALADTPVIYGVLALMKRVGLEPAPARE